MTLDYDFYFFIDDDTYVNIEKLQKYVETLDKNENLYIGHPCGEGHMSGGSGFILTKPTYLSLIKYIRETDESKLYCSIYGDLSIFIWLKNCNVKRIENRLQLNPDNFRLKENNHNNLSNFITAHYLKTKDDFLFYDNL